MQLSWTRLPFRYRTRNEYAAKLTEYIGDVFYERLPAAGYEVREEQIFTAFRMAQALVAGQVLLAEAGLGTGKTFAYLVPAVCHARLSGRPVVVSSASGVLQAQLANPAGDIATLSRVLDLQVDARTARDPRQLLCELKVDALRLGGVRRRGLTDLLRWAGESERGDRSEVPHVPDETWELVAWDESLQCDTCSRRGHCRLARGREHYRQAIDLIVCDHEFFFHDLWTRRARRDARVRPLLPDYSGVVFDEGHDVPDAAQRTAGYALRPADLHRTLAQSYDGSDRVGLLGAVSATHKAAQAFWGALAAAVVPADAERLHVQREGTLTGAAAALAIAVEKLQDELATEEAMHQGTDTETHLLALQARLDYVTAGLRMLRRPAAESVAWAAPAGDAYDLWTVPRRTDDLLQRELYSQRVPVVFSSATLASGDSFDYLKRVVGAPGALHAQVGVPFDLARQALVYVPADPVEPVGHLVQLLHATGGRALVLVNGARELQDLRAALPEGRLPWRLLWEGEAERAELLRRFKQDVSSVLIGTSYWEGIDVPGAALSCVAVLRLPFPPHDPVVTARREDAAAAGLDPFAAVDVPAMAIRLKQGRGRLIRTATDRGVLALLDTSFAGTAYEGAVRGAFPEDAPETGDLDEVRAFLAAPPHARVQ